MSPSTKNLRERIEEILKAMSFGIITNRESHPPRTAEEPLSLATDAIASILSSELSLAVKGLRESISKSDRGSEVPFVNEWAYDIAFAHVYKAFDSKAKEILGESS